MSKFIPDYVFDSIYDITPEILQSHGIRAVLIDLDGTMVSHKTALPTEEVAAFIRRLEDNGIHVVVFSNNNANRVGTFCEPLGGTKAANVPTNNINRKLLRAGVRNFSWIWENRGGSSPSRLILKNTRLCPNNVTMITEQYPSKIAITIARFIQG